MLITVETMNPYSSDNKFFFFPTSIYVDVAQAGGSTPSEFEVLVAQELSNLGN